jgi:hypothetical protein
MPCPVDFCRGNHPILPTNSHVLRASGDCLCPDCQKPIREHPKFAYPTGLRHVYRCCDGRFYHT